MRADLEAILDAISLGIHYWDIQTRGDLVFSGANQAADDLLHRSHSKLAGKAMEEIYTGLHPSILEAFRQVAVRGDMYTANAVQSLDAAHPGYWDMYAVRSSPQQLAILFREVTKHHQIELALHESETLYRELVSEINDGIFMTDAKGVLTFANRSLALMHGVEQPEVLIGRHILEFVAPEFHGKALEALLEGVQKGASLDAFELSMVRNDGSHLMAEINAVPHIINGRVVGTKGIVRDVTAREQAQEALRESEERYRSLVEFSPDAIAVHSEGILVFANSKAVELLRARSEEDIIGKPLLDFVHPDFRDIVAERARSVKASGTMAAPIDEQFIAFDGSILDVEVAAMPFKFHNKPAVLVVVRDISVRKKAEESLQKLFSAVEHTDEVIFMTDPDGAITYVNPAFERVYGYTRDEALGKTPRILKSGAMDRTRYEDMWRLLLTGQSFRGEIINKTRDGNTITMISSVNPIFGDAKTLTGFIAVQEDITQRKVMEEKLRHSEEQFRLITENAADLIEVLDLEGKRLYNSPSYKDLLGDPQRLQGTDSFMEIHPDDQERIQKAFRETIRTGVGQRAEYRIVTASGDVRHIESQGSVIKDRNDKPSQIVVVSRDVTEKKAMEQQFLRAQRMESIGTLAAGIAHDLNNVLSPIMLSMDLIRSKIHDQDLKRILSSVEVSAKRGSEIVRQVLAFGRGVDGQRILVQPKHLINEVDRIIRETFPKSIVQHTEAPKDLWQLHADPTQVHQVLLNICVNARDAMPDGGELRLTAENITLDKHYAQMHSEAKPGPYVLMTVSDSGTGIAPGIIERIFDPFFTTKEVGKGTGLGLSTVLSIVKNHGGFIKIYSEPGRGTSFRVYLPATLTRESKASVRIVPDLPRGSGERILVVDDEASIRQITKETLELYGYAVTTAADGTEALSHYAQHMSDISVVITDLMMPVLDGMATIRALRRMNPRVTIIATTGYAPDEGSRDTRGLHVDGFLSKPYTAEKLLVLLNSILTENKGI